MTTYTVHVYREMRLVYRDIEAGSHEEAARLASDQGTHDAESLEYLEGPDHRAYVEPEGGDPSDESRLVHLRSDCAPSRQELLRFLSDFLTVSYAGTDFWPDRDALLDRARRLLRQAKGRRPA